MNKVTHHIILNGKGGTCKTRTAVYLASYYKNKGMQTQNFDTDVVNLGFKAFEDLNVNKVRLYAKDDEQIVENLVSFVCMLSSSEKDTVTDIGNCDYLWFISYLNNKDTFYKLLLECKHNIIFHVPFSNAVNAEYLCSVQEKLRKYSNENLRLIYWEHLFREKFEEENKNLENISSDWEHIIIPCLSDLEMEQLEKALAQNIWLSEQSYFNSLSIVDKSRQLQIAKKIYFEIEKRL